MCEPNVNKRYLVCLHFLTIEVKPMYSAEFDCSRNFFYVAFNFCLWKRDEHFVRCRSITAYMCRTRVSSTTISPPGLAWQSDRVAVFQIYGGSMC